MLRRYRDPGAAVEFHRIVHRPPCSALQNRAGATLTRPDPADPAGDGAHADDIRALVAQRVAAGDARVHFVDTTGWLDPTIDTTDGLHPDAMGHQKAAERLEAVIRSLLTRFDEPLTGVVE